MKDNKVRTHIEEVITKPLIIDTPEAANKLLDALENPGKPNEALKNLMPSIEVGDMPEEEVRECLRRIKKHFEVSPDGHYQVIADIDELKWFFDHVIQRPQVNESYSAVFVSRHKKLTDEEAKQIGLTRKEGEFLSTVTFKLRAIKDASRKNDPEIWNFDNFVKTLRRFNVDKYAYTTALGEPIPSKTLAVIFYVNPGDDMKVCRKFVEEYNDVNEAISKAMLNGKSVSDNYQSYQWFGKAESTIKHLKANQKGTRYWLDFDVDVPAWWKTDKTVVDAMLARLQDFFGKGNYVIVDTSGGYHILVRTSAIKMDPHVFCKCMNELYHDAIGPDHPEYLDEKGNCKFECIVNDSQIPGLPLPGTYQYDRPVTVLNKEDFDGEDFVKKAMEPGNETIWLGGNE